MIAGSKIRMLSRHSVAAPTFAKAPVSVTRSVARFVACLLALATGCGTGDTVSGRPNVLIVVADDLAHAAVGAYGDRGHGTKWTPNLDRLAAESVVFDHATASSPFCTPSRQSFLTGRWPHAIGVTQVNSLLPEGARTLGHVFRDAGYATAAFGKMHWQRKRSRGVDRGFEAIADVEEWRAHLSPEDRAAYESYRDLWRERQEAGWSHLNLDADPVPLAEEHQYASWLVDRTLEFIEGAAERPYFAFCSFTEVHAPFAFPPSYAGRVMPDDVRLPAGHVEDLRENIPGVFATFRAREKQRGPLTDDARRQAVASYLTSAMWLDAQIGRLLEGLKQSPTADNTIVIFWSDHGFHLGEHGLLSKSVPFQEVVEAPLFIRAPGVPPNRSAALVQMLDVFPTLCDLTGVATPGNIDGLSLEALLEGGTSHRQVAYSEFIGLWGAMRNERWKLVLGHEVASGFDALYDLQSDPRETRSLFHDPAAAESKRDLTTAMGALLSSSPPDWISKERWDEKTGRDGGVRWALGQIER